MALNQDFGKGRGQKLIVRKCKCLTLETCVSELVYSNILQPGVSGLSPQPLGDFCVFGKKSYLSPIGSHFERVHSHLKELDFPKRGGLESSH